MPKFKLLSGKHRMPVIKDGKTLWRVYEKGEIIESDSDLSKKFKNKFSKISDSSDTTNTEVEAHLAAKQEEEEANARQAKKEEAAQAAAAAEAKKREQELAAEGDTHNEDEGGVELKIKGRGNKRTVIDKSTGDSVHDGFLTLEEAKELVDNYGFGEADETAED